MMTVWSEPGWDPDWLTPDRIYARGGFVLSGAEVARRGVAAARAWRDRLPPAGAGDAWVLVGGAGFLGARIAAALLRDGGTAPVVIVARQPEGVRAHWSAMMGASAAERMMRDPRLRLIVADLAGGEIGWTHAVPAAAVIVHLAAMMHALAGWDRLAPVNLGGLRGSVALARRDGALLQLASTLSVFVSSNAPRSDGAALLPAADDVWLHGGYAQTKAAAEHALAAADLDRWQIVRFGLLVPEAGRVFPADHFAPLFCDALRQVAAVPDCAERAMVDLTPVDVAADIAIQVARVGGPQVVHVANPVAAALEAVVHAIGGLPVIAVEAWRARVDALPSMPRALVRAAFEKTRFLERDAARGPYLNVDLFQSTHRRFGTDGMAGSIAGPDVLLPAMVASMIGKTGRE